MFLPSIDSDGELHVSGARRWYNAKATAGPFRFDIIISYKWVGDGWGVSIVRMLED